jgi:hypothetical protein
MPQPKEGPRQRMVDSDSEMIQRCKISKRFMHRQKQEQRKIQRLHPGKDKKDRTQEDRGCGKKDPKILNRSDDRKVRRSELHSHAVVTC